MKNVQRRTSNQGIRHAANAFFNGKRSARKLELSNKKRNPQKCGFINFINAPLSY